MRTIGAKTGNRNDGKKIIKNSNSQQIMSTTNKGINIKKYFDGIRSDTEIDKKTKVQLQKRWGGTGTVEIIYYLADNRILDYVRFKWRIISSNPPLTPPIDFRGNRVPLQLLPHLERAQSSNKEVFVDFFTDEAGGSAQIITIATLSSIAS
jgi:hypothetical protein